MAGLKDKRKHPLSTAGRLGALKWMQKGVGLDDG